MKNLFMLQGFINGCAFSCLSMSFSPISVKYGKEPKYTSQKYFGSNRTNRSFLFYLLFVKTDQDLYVNIRMG